MQLSFHFRSRWWWTFCCSFFLSHFLLSLLLLAFAALHCTIRQRYSSIAQNRRGADIIFLSFLTILPFFVLTLTHGTVAHALTHTLGLFSLLFCCCRYNLFCSSQTTQTQNLLLFCCTTLCGAMHVRVSPSFAIQYRTTNDALFSSKRHTHSLNKLFFSRFRFLPT